MDGGDWTIDWKGVGRTNIRVPNGASHTIDVEPGDKVLWEPPTLPDIPPATDK